MIGYDHRPVVAYFEDKVPRQWERFRFDKKWIGYDGLLESIGIGWVIQQRGTRLILNQKLLTISIKLLFGERIMS